MMRNKLYSAPAAIIVMAIMLLFFASYLPHRSAIAQTSNLTELSIDNGVANCVTGVPTSPTDKRGIDQFGWANKLTPSRYPATLRAVTIGLNRSGPLGDEVLPEQPYRVNIYIDPESDGPSAGQQPDATFIIRARGRETPLTFNVAIPLTITSGSFVVAVIDEFKIASFPAQLNVPGKSTPPGSDSFITEDAGAHWFKFSNIGVNGSGQCGQPGSFLIRATVQTGTVDDFSITKITDPAAVEPWGVSVGEGFTLVTNYVSDNLTVIKTLDNSVQNIPLGDGPGGTPDGPYGVVGPRTIFPPGGDVGTQKAYITLFGSNTIPTKEFPVDYSTVGDGRVVVLNMNTTPPTTLATINVGKGPRFPVLLTAGGKTKLYVPCGGDNRVDVIDTATNSVIAHIPVGADPSSCTPSLSGDKIYVTNFGDGTISVINPVTDTKIRDIPAPSVPIPQPFGSTPSTVNVALKNPWQATVSQKNGNLYVTYWGTVGDVFPNGAIAVFETCGETFLRATLDDQTRGTAPGSAGASGIPAPTSPLVRDPATGTTPGAGGGGGGPFGIAAGLKTNPLVFTNDGVGIAGILDPLIDQVISVPPDGLAMCAKPRGIGIGSASGAPPPAVAGAQRVAVACGQPDNAVLIFNVPTVQPVPIFEIPVITSAEVTDAVRLVGSGFVAGDKVQIIDRSTGECFAFNKKTKIKKNGTVLVQRGNLVDGRSPSQIADRAIRFIHRDGTVIIP